MRIHTLNFRKQFPGCEWNKFPDDWNDAPILTSTNLLTWNKVHEEQLNPANSFSVIGRIATMLCRIPNLPFRALFCTFQQTCEHYTTLSFYIERKGVIRNIANSNNSFSNHFIFSTGNYFRNIRGNSNSFL
jgi:hypothetical protein